MATVVALFGAAEATPAATPAERSCEDVAGRAWSSPFDGTLTFYADGTATWVTLRGIVLPATFQCGLDGLSIRFDEGGAGGGIDIRGDKLLWGSKSFDLQKSAVIERATAAPGATERPPPEPITGKPEPCDSLVGSIFEIKSLEGLPGSADRLTGESDGAAPRRPYLVFGKGVGTWVNARGDEAPIGWRCDDQALTVTISGKPTVMFREGSGFRFGGAPVRRFQPKAATPGTTLTCAELPGTVFEVRGTGSPLGSTKGKGGFESDIDEGPRPPSLRFSADGKTLDYVDDDRRTFTVAYGCDESGVKFQIRDTPNHLLWDGSGMRWRERSVRPYQTR